MGGKGGGGKSTLMTSLVDFFHAENCPVTLIDCDIENKVHGSFSHFFKEALKVDITTPSGFDEFVEKVLYDNRAHGAGRPWSGIREIHVQMV